MKLIIAGSRHMQWSSAPLIELAVQESGFEVTEVVCGMAKGADTLGRMWAEFNGIPVKKFPADWNKYGKAAGPIRNGEMKDYADGLIVFIWDGSRGSENMRVQMEKAGKPCFVVYDGQL
jgi:hypothetical protein